jgi:hypothetical protein
MRDIVTHVREVTPLSQSITLAAHRPLRGQSVQRDPHPEEKAIADAASEIALYVAALKQKSRKVVALALRQLLRCCGSIRANRSWRRYARPTSMGFTI